MSRKNQKDIKMSKRGTYFFQEIMSHLSLIGTCHCGKSLFSLIGLDDNKFNYYCLECGSIGDVRVPHQNDVFLIEKDAPTPVSIIQQLYKKVENIEITDEDIKNTPISQDIVKN